MAERFYSFRMVSYASEEEIQNLLKYCSKWEYIRHDKDIKDDGSLKEPHWHINVILKQWRTVKGVCELVKSEQNTFAYPMLDKVNAHEYLTHKNDPDKFQYNEEEIKHSSKLIVEDNQSKADLNEEFIRTLETALTLREKAIKLGRDFIKYRKEYEQFVKDMWEEERLMKIGYDPEKISCFSYEEFLADIEITKFERRRELKKIREKMTYEEMINLLGEPKQESFL